MYGSETPPLKVPLPDSRLLFCSVREQETKMDFRPRQADTSPAGKWWKNLMIHQRIDTGPRGAGGFVRTLAPPETAPI